MPMMRSSSSKNSRDASTVSARATASSSKAIGTDACDYADEHHYDPPPVGHWGNSLCSWRIALTHQMR